MKPNNVIKRLNQLSERYAREVAATKAKCEHRWTPHIERGSPAVYWCAACSKQVEEIPEVKRGK